MGQIIFFSENFFAVTQGSQPGTATIIVVTPANWMWSLINSRITEKAFRADSGRVFDPKKQSNLSGQILKPHAKDLFNSKNY